MKQSRKDEFKVNPTLEDMPEHRSTENGCEEGCEACATEATPQRTPTPLFPLKLKNGNVYYNNGTWLIKKSGFESPETLAFIVRAVNAHDQLVTWAKDVCKELRFRQKQGPIGADLSDSVSLLEQAIAKAEGK